MVIGSIGRPCFWYLGRPMSKAYLAAFNVASAAGWALVVAITAQCLLAGAPPQAYWAAVGPTLKVVQSLAFLEVLHSFLGLVRSPLFTTFLQVSSRLILLWCYTAQVAAGQSHWSLYLMAGSWALVEVPRYVFYALNLYMKTVPLPLFFLRYNLFMALYPSGISGEILQMYTSLPHLSPVCWRLTVTLLAVYVPSGPFMVMNMFAQRKRANRARTDAAKAAAAAASGGAAAAAAEGLLFPLAADGERSTTAAGKMIFAASVKGVDAPATAAVEAERNWRFGYGKHVVRNVELCLTSPAAALTVSNQGLDAALDSFEFIRAGSATSLRTAMATYKGTFDTGFVRGSAPRPASQKLEVPYKGDSLTEATLLEKLNRWAKYGTIEPSAQAAIAWLVANPGSLDLSSRYFVLLGAGSAMGPLLVLLNLGANVVAVDLNREAIWARLLSLADASCGTLTFPIPVGTPASALTDTAALAKVAGCNLFTHTPEIRNWLAGVCPGKKLVVGGYAYLDSAAHVQVSLAMVAIMDGLLTSRPGTSFAFLCSPTDVFVQPAVAVEAVKANLRTVPLWQSLVRSLSGGRVLKTNLRTPVNEHVVVNGIVVAQGPNYALAKRLQHWFAIKARMAGAAVSSNVAPSTATASVVSNAQFAAAYGGFKLFKPMEVFYQDTSNAVMGALLIHDVCNPASKAQPSTPLSNPTLQFSVGAFHGGIWRCAFTIDSIGALAATAFYLDRYKAGIVGGVAALGGWVAWVAQ